MSEERPLRIRILGYGIMVGILFVMLVVSLFLAEGVVRVVAPQQLILLRPDIWEPADSLGWVHRPSVDTQVNTGERTVRWATDTRGFRVGINGVAPEEEAGASVLLIGDSFVAAMQVEQEQSLAGLMEQDLRDAIRAPVRVDNSAVTSWDPPHYIINARRLIPHEDYDLVVVGVYLGNDVVPARIEAYPRRTPAELARFRLPSEISRRELIESIARPVNDMLKTRSHLFILVKNSMDALLMRLGLTAVVMPWEVQTAHADADAWEVTTAILHEIHELGEVNDTPVVFVLIPSKYQVEDEALESHGRALGFGPSELDPDQPNRILGSLMREAGLHVIDPLHELRAASERGEQLYGTVDRHFSPEGHHAVWEAIRVEILSQLRAADQVPSEVF